MDEATRQKIDREVQNHDVVLFMKGTPQAPRCGFSATVAGILDELVGKYQTVDVLADAKIREGIKEYSDWPTIPQLYIKGQFVGGCDLVREMYENGELHEALGLKPEAVELPKIVISPGAASALAEALAEATSQEPDGGHHIRVEIGADFQHALSISDKKPRDVEVTAGALTLLLDPPSARRASGLSIDYVDGPDGPAFKLENPNEPPRVKSVSVKDLAAKLRENSQLELFDVRSQKEREQAQIAGSKLLDRPAQDYIMTLDKSTPLFFMCHHGQRSQQAAGFFLSHGFSNVFSVSGGIDAWSLEVDSKIPRY
ncbi:MAG TPA: Grx4 family monothiol glutaredoxin [Polyangiaceae bacterium]|nr:Grx4 family monothiol glutaredoxin [Polyangiaceae bacterium]